MKAVMLWSGGKDSCLALLRALDQRILVPALVTFVPADGRDFLAHPRSLIEKQALAMNLRHAFLPVSEPYDRGYEEKLSMLRDAFGIEGVITGDIDMVAGQSNWMEARCSRLDMKTIRPLWKNDRLSLMKEILERKIEARITWINHTEIPLQWKGRAIDHALLIQLEELSDRKGLDLCGENGEYHTMATNSPIFSRHIQER